MTTKNNYFYNELQKALNENTTDEDDGENICKITYEPLTNKHVMLECKHKFNYDALYKELCNQKFKFKTYALRSMSFEDKIKYRNANVNHFIRCPYCRNMQFSILPYYDDLPYEPMYGINSLDTSLPSALSDTYDNNNTFISYGQQFKKGVGQCCHKEPDNNMNICMYKFVAPIPETNKIYCYVHYRHYAKLHKLEQIEKMKEQIEKIKEEKAKAKEELKAKTDAILAERQKLFDQINAERASKGRKLITRLPLLKNVVQQEQPIGQYVPEEDTNGNIEKNGHIIINKCKAIIHSGPNKGKLCGCKIMKDNKDETTHKTKIIKYIKYILHYNILNITI